MSIEEINFSFLLSDAHKLKLIITDVYKTAYDKKKASIKKYINDSVKIFEKRNRGRKTTMKNLSIPIENMEITYTNNTFLLVNNQNNLDSVQTFYSINEISNSICERFHKTSCEIKFGTFLTSLLVSDEFKSTFLLLLSQMLTNRMSISGIRGKVQSYFRLDDANLFRQDETQLDCEKEKCKRKKYRCENQELNS